jgi:hypothetical protein
MKYTCLMAAIALIPAWGQGVKPTPGALTPSNVAAAPVTATPGAGSVSGSIPKGAPARDAMKRLESDFDYQLKTADQAAPMDLLGYTRGLYLQGFGAVFTAELDLAQTNILPMFHPTHTPDEKVKTRERKLKHLELLRQQMRGMVASVAKSLDLGPNDQVVVAIKLMYQGWEDRTGLPEQIVMRADRRGALAGDVKVEVQ